MGTALIAVGGFGRGVLIPGSDVDLVVLHDGRSPHEVEAFAERFLHPLWDARIVVGHAVRTPEESRTVAGERLDALTSLLDGRPLAGDESLARRIADDALSIARVDPGGFLVRLGRAASARRERYGSVSYLLEPNLKEGGGGLRDVASFGWFERALGRSLEEEGLLREAERHALQAAEEFLTRVRSALHLETGKRADRLVLEHQSAIARAMGFGDEPRLIAEDGLMRAVFEHARQVDFLIEELLIGRRRFEADAPPPTLPADAAGVFGAFLDDAGEPREPSLAELDAIQSLEAASDRPWDEAAREAFLRVVVHPEGWRALETLDRLGVLVRLLPEWADVRCRPQRDPYHRFTVDMHLLTAMRQVAAALRSPSRSDPVEVEAVKEIADPAAVVVGALLHDIGKIGEGNHVPIGTRIATAVLDRIGLEPRGRELALFMVEQHLLLPDTATRRDLTDDDLVLDVAARIGTPERLAALYVLAGADAAATGPAATTDWRATLIRELAAKVRRVFQRGEMGQELAERLAERVDQLRDLLPDRSSDEVDRFVLRMPRGYFLSVEPAQIARHFGTIVPPLEQHDVRTASWLGSRAKTYELLVVAPDRPGLLSWIAGSLALEGLSILTAQVFTTEDGAAVDLFEVEGVFDPDVREETWRDLRSALRKTIEGRLSLEHRVAEKRMHYPPPRSRTPVTVAVDNEASDFFTVIEVGAPDRIGLLYDITRTLAEMQLDVHLAKVATYGGRVVDAFYVRDALGRKVADPEHVDEIDRAMRARLDV